MKISRKIYLFLIAIVACIITSCENKWPINGDLDGQWQLMTLEQDGKIKEMKEERVYWNFQLHMLMLCSKEIYYAHFEHDGSTIRLFDISFSSANEKAEDDNIRMSEEEIKSILSPLGISKKNETYEIERLTDETMILKTDDKLLRFRKF